MRFWGGVVLLVMLAVGFPLGTGSAAASTNVLCSVNEKVCPEKSVISSVEATLQAKTTMTIGHIAGETDVTCTKAGFSAHAEEPYEPEELWFFKPSGPGGCGGTGYKECEASFEHSPWNAKLTAPGGGNGTIVISAGASGSPQFKIHCVFFNVPFTCVYSRESFSMEFKGGSPALVHEEAMFKCTSGSGGIFCPELTTVKADYELTSPAGAVYMTTG